MENKNEEENKRKEEREREEGDNIEKGSANPTQVSASLLTLGE